NFGNPSSVRYPLGSNNFDSFFYNGANKYDRRVSSLGDTTTFSYCNSGQIKSITNDARVETFGFDYIAGATTVHYSGGAQDEIYTYAGTPARLQSIRESEGTTTSYAYVGTLSTAISSMTDSFGGSTTYTYADNFALKTVTENGLTEYDVTTFAPDGFLAKAGVLNGHAFSGATYNALGQLETMINGNGSLT